MADEVEGLAVKIAMEQSSFQSGMSDLKRSLSVINSEFKSSLSALGEFGNGLDGLKVKASSLGEKIDIQKQIVEKYQNQLDKSKASLQENAEKMLDLKSKVEAAKAAWEESFQVLGKNAEETKKLESEFQKLNNEYKTQADLVRNNTKTVDGYTIQLNSAKTALNNMEHELQQINKDVKSMESGMSNAEKEVKKLGNESEGASHKLNALGETLTKIGGVIAKGAVVGIAAIGAALTAAVGGAFKLAEKASDLSESQNVVQQTFKKSSAGILEWTKTVAESAGISQANATKFVGAMGAMLKSSGISEENASKMAESLVQLTGDMSSFYNLPHDEMWEKIRSGVSGEIEPLRSLGINMSVRLIAA
jgi:phage-related tail protein